MAVTHPTGSREATEARITALYNLLRNSQDGTQRIQLREAIDRLLEEHHERWPAAA